MNSPLGFVTRLWNFLELVPIAHSVVSYFTISYDYNYYYLVVVVVVAEAAKKESGIYFHFTERSPESGICHKKAPTGLIF